ncbi:hypothetical protein WPAWT_00043 [Pseudomonas aeruginosa]|nr:hypothetical protein WPAWT_00043 [Pseudomonas aeruginosa]
MRLASSSKPCWLEISPPWRLSRTFSRSMLSGPRALIRPPLVVQVAAPQVETDAALADQPALALHQALDRQAQVAPGGDFAAVGGVDAPCRQFQFAVAGQQAATVVQVGGAQAQRLLATEGAATVVEVGAADVQHALADQLATLGVVQRASGDAQAGVAGEQALAAVVQRGAGERQAGAGDGAFGVVVQRAIDAQVDAGAAGQGALGAVVQASGRDVQAGGAGDHPRPGCCPRPGRCAGSGCRRRSGARRGCPGWRRRG